MRMMVLALLAGLVVSSTPAVAQQAVLDAERAVVGDACNSVVFLDTFARPVDINGDDLEDVMLDYAGLVCDGYEFGFCGSGGCTQSLYIQQPEGTYIRVGAFQAYDMVFDRPAEASFLVVRDGGWCGLSGAESCTVRYRLVGATLEEIGAEVAPGSGNTAS